MQNVLRLALFAVVLGSAHLNRSGLASGHQLPAGTYEIRLTDDAPLPPGAGQAPGAERWVEFVQHGQVVGREVATVISAADMRTIAKGAQPGVNRTLVQTLKGGDYVRIWVNKDGTNYLINLPTQR